MGRRIVFMQANSVGICVLKTLNACFIIYATRAFHVCIFNRWRLVIDNSFDNIIESTNLKCNSSILYSFLLFLLWRSHCCLSCYFLAYYLDRVDFQFFWHSFLTSNLFHKWLKYGWMVLSMIQEEGNHWGFVLRGVVRMNTPVRMFFHLFQHRNLYSFCYCFHNLFWVSLVSTYLVAVELLPRLPLQLACVPPSIVVLTCPLPWNG